MSQELFRREALEARRTSWLGAISLAQPLQLWLLTVLAVLAALAIVAFLVLGTYTRRSSVAGQLVPTRGLATVLAPSTGVVADLRAREGQRVDAGQALAVVKVPRATPSAGDTQAALEARLAQRQAGGGAAANHFGNVARAVVRVAGVFTLGRIHQRAVVAGHQATRGHARCQHFVRGAGPGGAF